MRKVLIGVLAATLFVAACGGSSKKSGTGSSGGTTTTGPGGSTSPASTSSGGGNDISKLAAQYAKAKIKITYSSSGSDFTLAQDGNGKSAFTSGTSTIYNDGKTSVSCEGTGTSATCTQLPSVGGGVGALGSTFTATFTALASLLSTLGTGHTSSESIANRDASCVTYKASEVFSKLGSSALFKGAVANASDYDPNDTATICIDKQTGFVVKIAATKKGQPQDQLTATAISVPTDSDFTPPVTPQTIPNITLPGGSTIPGTNG